MKMFVYRKSFMTIPFMNPVTGSIMYCQKFSLDSLNKDRIRYFGMTIRGMYNHLLMCKEEINIQTKLKYM